jgi:gliding motility-associated lipoprotein GldD
MNKGNDSKFLMVALFIFISACKGPAVPKPRGYFRIDFPEKKYERFNSDCAFSFEAPVYGKILRSGLPTAGPCWYDIRFNDYGATLYLTYKSLRNSDLAQYSEDVRRIVYKHIVKADDIVEVPVDRPGSDVYGFIYYIEGNTASSVNFYITDSTTGFVNGSLYFDVRPNIDSLAPSIEFFKKDIIHFINSFEWELKEDATNI